MFGQIIIGALALLFGAAVLSVVIEVLVEVFAPLRGRR